MELTHMTSADIRNNFNTCLEYIENLESKLLKFQEKIDSFERNSTEYANKQTVEENALLKRRLKMAYGFFYSEKELKEYQKFLKRHVNCKGHPYVVQDGNGIGIESKVICPACGEFKDLTDINAW